jgi:Protein of unknown function (DUF3108)
MRARKSFTILLAAALLCAAAALASPRTAFADGATRPADAKTHATPLPFAPDEELIFQADFSKLLLRGIEIAEFRFTVGRAPLPANAAEAATGQHPPAALLYVGDVRAKGWFRKLFGVDFHYNHEAVVDPESLLILRTTKLDEQGKRVRESEAVFDRVTNTVTWTERNPNDAQSQPRVVRNVLDGAAHDIISAIYYLRTRQLRTGESFELAVSDSGQTYRVPVRVRERKTLKTVVGRVPTLRVDIGLFGEGRLVGDRKGEMSVWITDDARRIPVRARLDADLGTLDIKLKKASTNKSPK